MEIILLKDLEKVGKKGEVVNVRDGFGRNFLLPSGFALPASRANRIQVEKEKKQAAGRRARKKAEAEQLAQKLASLRLRIEVAVGEKDQMFGSVTAQDLEEALRQKGVSLDKKQFFLAEPLRTLGVHAVSVELDPEVKATLQVDVIRKA